MLVQPETAGNYRLDGRITITVVEVCGNQVRWESSCRYRWRFVPR
jgi:hypothetical protein